MAIAATLGFKPRLIDNWNIDFSEVTPIAASSVLVFKAGTNTLFRSTGAAGESFGGVLADPFGAESPADAARPVIPDTRPPVWVDVRDAPVLIEDAATVGVGDSLTYSTVTAGTLRPALAGEAAIMRASTALTVGGVGLTVLASTVGGAHLGGSAFAASGPMLSNVSFPDITAAVVASVRIDRAATLTAIGVAGTSLTSATNFTFQLNGFPLVAPLALPTGPVPASATTAIVQAIAAGDVLTVTGDGAATGGNANVTFSFVA